MTVIEGADRLGGKVLTCRVGEFLVDTGPDSLLGLPALRSLLEDLGLADAVVPVAPLGFYVWSRGKLRRMPPGTLFGVPDRLIPLLRSRLLSPLGVLRAGLDLLLPRQYLPDDASVAELLRPRFGTQLFERLVEPLLGGIHAGSASELSARSTVPDIDALVRANRSPYLAVRRLDADQQPATRPRRASDLRWSRSTSDSANSSPPLRARWLKSDDPARHAGNGAGAHRGQGSRSTSRTAASTPRLRPTRSWWRHQPS